MFLHTHPYEPFLFQDATKLIVGTLPPPRFTTGDLKEGDVNFCYGSRDGQLWPILDRIFELNLDFETTEKAYLLKSANLKISKIVLVPGVFEIPVIISKNIDKFDAFIALGCVIKGKTPHFDLISQAVTKGIMDLSIKYKKPIGNGIITCLNKKQALIRSNPMKKNKGGEAARAALSVLGILRNDKKRNK